MSLVPEKRLQDKIVTVSQSKFLRKITWLIMVKLCLLIYKKGSLNAKRS